MKDHVFERLKTMTPSEVENYAKTLEKIGVTDPEVLKWIRLFATDKTRAELVRGAKPFEKFLADMGGVVGEYKKTGGAGLNAENADEWQDCAMSALTLFADTSESPWLKNISVLKNVAAGIYDVGEAWVFIYYLNKSEKTLATATDSQLVAQKILIKRVAKLMQARNKARADLKNVQASP
jgi:hypothetical protein